MLPHVRGRPSRWSASRPASARRASSRRTCRRGSRSWLERVEVERATRRIGDGALPARRRRALAGLDGEPELDHAARLDLARAGPLSARTSACSISIRPATIRTRCARRRSRCATLLDELGLPTFVKTSGSKGFHIVVPLDGEADSRASWRSRTAPARCWSSATRTLLTQEFIKADRGGRIFVDTGRNGQGATFAAVYAVRPKPGAPVSAPCTWDEVEQATVGPATFTLRTMAGAHRRRGRSLGGRSSSQRRCSLREPPKALERHADRRRLEGSDGRVDAPADVAQGGQEAIARNADRLEG